MSFKFFRSISLIIWLLAVITGARSQDIEFRHISIDDGLSQNTVNSIIQDRRGIIWAGTLGGLNKFDGYEFVVYDHDESDSTSLSHNRINIVFEDSKGNLWVGTDYGLNLFNPLTENFRLFRNAQRNRYSVYSIKEDRNGTIWVGADQGLKSVDRKNFTLIDADLQITGYKKRVQCISVSKEGNLWVGLTNGVKVFNPFTRKVISKPGPIQGLKSDWIQSIKHLPNGDVWICTDTHGLYRYIKTENRLLNYNESNGLKSNAIRDMIATDPNTIWIGTKMGLSILDVATQKIRNYDYSPTINPANSLSHSSVRCIMQDRSGNVWMGTYSGGINLVYNFNKIFSYKGHRIGDNNNLANKEVNGIVSDDGINIWIATDGGGINNWNRATGKVEVFKYNGGSPLLNHVKDVAPSDDKNKLWVGTTAGIVIFDKRTKTFTEFKKEQERLQIEFAHDYRFLNSSMGLWVGTNYRGLLLIKDNQIARFYNYDSGVLLSNNISALLTDSKNNLWIGHLYSGLNYLNVKTGKVSGYTFLKTDSNSLSNNAVSCLFMDSKKRLWVGTAGGGLNYYDSNKQKFYRIDQQHGLANNIQSIQEDDTGALWVATNNGISELVIKKNEFPVKRENISIINYTVQDGLQSNQFSKGASYKAPNGELYFGGINGLTHFFPDKITLNKERPNIVLTSFNILNQKENNAEHAALNKPIDYLKEITLNYDETYFTIKYAALNYIYPERNTYAYKLEGLANDIWHYVADQRTAIYTGLEPGTYHFKVKAANNSGIWGYERSLKIIVLPPWWRTTTAYVAYLLIIIALLYWFNHYSKYTERLKNRLAYEADSYRREQELTQKKLSFFINISHEIKTPITMIMGPLQKLLTMHEENPKTAKYLTLMNRSGQRLLNLVDQLLDFRKLDADNIHLKAAEGNLIRFTREIVIVFSNLAKAKDIDIQFVSNTEELSVWYDRDKLEKILYNLISNAIKYTPAFGNVKVEVSKKLSDEGDLAVISVIDNGSGISADRLENIFQPFQHYDSLQNNVSGTGVGLAFAKELIELHHGKIEVESVPAENAKHGYTCFSVSIPMGNSYLDTAEIDESYLKPEEISSYRSYHQNQRESFKERKSAISAYNNNEQFSMLLVEDNPDVLNFLTESFNDDFNVIGSTNGQQGLSEALKVLPDIIISDVMMPEMNGIEFCSKVKSDILTSHIPVILLTARSPLIFKLEGLETGADEYITKPFNFDLLEVKVWNLLENRQKMKLRYQKEITLQPTNASISTFDDKFIEKVMKYIEDNMAEELLNVEELSQHVGMSRGNLYKKLKALTSKSPVEFIRYVRLSRAAQLLKQQKIYINEVAYMVGFQDVTYFRKCFKEEFGVTPTEYAKNGSY